jgi:hypothetical protein
MLRTEAINFREQGKGDGPVPDCAAMPGRQTWRNFRLGVGASV